MKQFFLRYPLLIGIVLVAFLVRLYRVDNPLLDWHSFRQADTASVTREYIKHSIDPLHPRYQDLSNIQSGQDNTEGWRMVEFPVHSIITAGILTLIPALPLELTSRFVSILFSLGSLISLFFLTKDVFGKRVAYIGILTFALLPYSIYYSRAVLPEPVMLFFLVLSLASFNKWLHQKKWSWYIVSLASFALALVTKPFVLFLGPVYLALAFNRYQLTAIKNAWLYVYVLIGIIPFLAWRQWIAQFPSGIPASEWLFNSDNIRLRPAWFYWLGYERLIKLFLGWIGFIFFPFSILTKNADELRVLLGWWAGIVIYFIVIAAGNVRHDYYQVLMIPIVCLTVAVGFVHLQRWLEKFVPARIGLASVSTMYVLMLVLSGTVVHGYFNVNHWEHAHAGKVADELLPPEAKVIAPANGDTSFLFQTNRTGWPIGFNIDEKIAKGATHYVSTSYDDEARELAEKYFIIEQTEDYIIIDLRREKQQ